MLVAHKGSLYLPLWAKLEHKAKQFSPLNFYQGHSKTEITRMQ